MGTTIKKRQPATGLSSSEKHRERSTPTQTKNAAKPNSIWRVRDFAIAVGLGVVGWALCGAVVGIGTQFFSMNTTLIIHAAAVPAIFGSRSWLLFKKLGATNPLQTAIVFLAVVITLDFFIVSLLIEGNFDMFQSVIGTWIPFALIFVTTYLGGAFVVAGRATSESGMIEAFAPADRIKRAYNILSLGYAGLLSPLERKPRMIGLERAAIRPDDNVLEVAVGPGHSFVEILKRVAPAKTVSGVDLSPNMLAQTRTDVLRIRFCLAPTSSSPSRNRTRTSPLFSTSRSGTDPPSLISSIRSDSSANASSERRYSILLFGSEKSGKTERVSWRTGSPTRSFGRAKDMRASIQQDENQRKTPAEEIRFGTGIVRRSVVEGNMRRTFRRPFNEYCGTRRRATITRFLRFGRLGSSRGLLPTDRR